MEYIVHRIFLDLHDVSSQVTFRVKKDTTKRKIYITLREGGQPYQIAEDCLASLSAKKPDGNPIYNQCRIVDNTIEYIFTDQTTAAVGVMDCQVNLWDDNAERIASPHFTIEVVPDAFYGDEIISTPEANAFIELLDRADGVISDAISRTDEAIGRVDEAASRANEAINEVRNQTTEAINEVERQTAEAISDINTRTDEAIGDVDIQVDEAINEVKNQTNEAVSRVDGVIDNINTTFANAFKGSKSGAVVQLDDVSPVEHIVGCKVKSKNLFNTYLEQETKTVEGITFIFNGDGTVSIDGTSDCSASTNASASRHFLPSDVQIYIKKGSTVAISGVNGIVNGRDNAYRIRLFTNTETSKEEGGLQGDYYQTTIINITEDCIVTSGYIQILDGYTVDNVVIKPQLEISSVATEYTPYVDVSTVKVNRNGEEFSVAADGTVEGITSIAPSMTINTDTAGTIVEVEYNRDSNKVYKELYNFLEQGGLTGPAARIANVKLLASAWTGTASPYSQVVTINGATANTQVDLTPSAAQLAIFHNKDLAFVTENENGVVTVYAIGQKPANDYTIQATLTEVMR